MTIVCCLGIPYSKEILLWDLFFYSYVNKGKKYGVIQGTFMSGVPISTLTVLVPLLASGTCACYFGVGLLNIFSLNRF